MTKPTRGMLIVVLGSHLQEARQGRREVSLDVYDQVDVFRAERAGLIGWNGRVTHEGRSALEHEGYLDA